jgi:hypothetical protein
MTPYLPAALLVLLASPAIANPSFVCGIAARVPYTAAIKPGFDNTRVFTQTADLIEERRSGNSVTYHWTVIADTPEQVVAIDEGRNLTLILDRAGPSFAESGVRVQRRGYCHMNDLP